MRNNTELYFILEIKNSKKGDSFQIAIMFSAVLARLITHHIRNAVETDNGVILNRSQTIHYIEFL